MLTARLRLFSQWVAQVADWCLRVTAIGALMYVGPPPLAAWQLAVPAAFLGLIVLCWVTAWFTLVSSDQLRAEKPRDAVSGFLRDAARIWRVDEARGSLRGLASFQALTTAGAGVLLASSLTSGFERGHEWLRALLFGGGAAAAIALVSWQRHPVRKTGLAPYGALGVAIALAWSAWATEPATPLQAMPAFLLGFMGVLVNAPLRAAYLAATPADARGNSAGVEILAIYVLTAAVASMIYGLAQIGVLPTPFLQLGFLALIAGLGATLAVWFLFRPMLENVVECLIWPIYRIRAYGPGVGKISLRGPVLIVANHTAYADPFWVGKVVPRSIVPMMTSVFYDLPIIHWWMVHFMHAIRVEAGTFRRETPELQEAIDRLRQGHCLVMFPEGRLRRSEGVLLRPFGQGVWHILREVPETVVVVLWMEGGWGTYTSYYNGPPMKNKRFDWWRRIDVGVGEPRRLDPELLKDQRRTRVFLRHACLECRDYLNLPPIRDAHDEKEDGQAKDMPA